MREIDCEQIILAVKNLCINANCFLPADVRRALDRESEQSEVGRAILGDLAENYRLADAEHLPICQDTGMAVLFVELGQEVHITGGLLEDALNEGVRRGYVDGLLRLSVVADPIRRGNTNDNTPAVIHLRLVKGDQLKITVAPKGFGSENMSVLKMFKPAATVEEIEDFIVSAVGPGRFQSLSAHRAGRRPGRHVGTGDGAGQARSAAPGGPAPHRRVLCRYGAAAAGEDQPPGHRSSGSGRHNHGSGGPYRNRPHPHRRPALRAESELPCAAARGSNAVKKNHAHRKKGGPS